MHYIKHASESEKLTGKPEVKKISLWFFVSAKEMIAVFNKQLRKLSILIVWLLTFAVEILIPLSDKQPVADAPYFLYFLYFIGIVIGFFYLVSLVSDRLDTKFQEKAPLLAGGLMLVNIINLICGKFAILPVLFFPSPDRILGVFVNDRILLLECVLSSGRLLLIGFVIGGVLGFFTGILVGFNKKASYWINPLTKMIGPIPATSWSPLVLSLFSTSYQAAVFMIALAVWFPISVMTSNGIQNVQQTYFEVADTLGARKIHKIFRVGIPAALPSVFLGVFYATTSSFVTLVTAEMFGCKSGIGWYLNWQKSMMLYANVYAGLILLAVLCNLIITLLFKAKDHVLVWQKGVIKW